MPAWVFVALLIITGAGAATGLILKDSLQGTTTVAVSQAILIDYSSFSYSDVHGDFDEAFVSVNDDGSEWAVHIENNNGDVVWYDLPVVNTGDENIVVQLDMWADTHVTYDVTPLFYWSDADHDEMVGTGESLVYTTDLILDRADIVKVAGEADFVDFAGNHWFFDGSLVTGYYGPGEVWGPYYNDDIYSDLDGNTPEAILLDDGDGILVPGPLNMIPDRIITPGQAALAEYVGPYAIGIDSVGRFFFTDNVDGIANRWDTGEDLYLNNDGDGYFTTSADLLVDADGYATSNAGTAAAIEASDPLEPLDDGDDLYWDDDDATSTFTSGDHLWLDRGDNLYFNSNGESISDTNPDTDLTSPAMIYDASLDIAFDGGASSTYYLENSGSIAAASLSTLGLEDVAPSAIMAGDIVEVDAQGNWYIVNDKSGDLDQRSTIQLIGDTYTSGDGLKGLLLNEQVPTLDPTEDLHFGSPSVFESADTDELAIAYDTDSDRVVIAYRDNGNSGYGTAVVGTVSATSITFGTPVVFESAATSQIATVYDDNQDRVIIAYRDEGNLDYGTAIVGSVSGNTLNFGTPVVFESDPVLDISATNAPSADRVVIAYRDEGNLDYGTAIVGSVSGSTIAFGTPVVFESAATSQIASTYAAASGRVVIAYRDEGNLDRGTAVVATVSGSTITYGAPVVYGTSATSWNALTYDSAAQRVVVAYRDGGNFNYGTSRVGTVSGTAISFGAAQVFESAASSAITATFNDAVNRVVIGYSDQGNGNYGTAVVGTVSGSTISFGTARAFESASTGQVVSVFDPTNNRVVHAYQDVANSDYGTAVVSTVSGSGVFVEGTQTLNGDGTLALSVDNGRGGLVDASRLDGGEVWALDNDGVLGSETVYLILDMDAGSSTATVQILGPGGQSLPDNYQFYAVTLTDSGTSADLDDYYLDSGVDIAAALDDALTGVGSAVYGSAGFGGLYKLDSDDSSTASAVIVTPGSSGTDVADDLKLGLVNGGQEAKRDRILRGSPTNDVTFGTEVVTNLTQRFSFFDDDDDDEYDNGEDLYEEETGGAGTYTGAMLDTLIYDGGTTEVFGGSVGVAGSIGVSIDDDDNIMFRDSDHDGAYDWAAGTYEPLLYTGSADIDPEGVLTPSVVVLARYGGDWPGLAGMDLWRLESDFSGANGHDYYFIDDDADGYYDDGEAILDQYGGTSVELLERSGDFVLHQGRANLVLLPISQMAVGNSAWKFMVPGVTDIGSPLEIRVTIALEDAAPTRVYYFQGLIRPLNV